MSRKKQHTRGRLSRFLLGGTVVSAMLLVGVGGLRSAPASIPEITGAPDTEELPPASSKNGIYTLEELKNAKTEPDPQPKENEHVLAGYDKNFNDGGKLNQVYIFVGDNESFRGKESFINDKNKGGQLHRAVSFGHHTVAGANNTVALGRMTQALKQDALAAGYGTVAFGEDSVATGILSSATGVASHAGGYNATASGRYSTAWGNSSKATGANSTAFGGSLPSGCCVGTTTDFSWYPDESRTDGMQSYRIEEVDRDGLRGGFIVGENGDLYVIDIDKKKAWFRGNYMPFFENYRAGKFDDPEKFKKKIRELTKGDGQYDISLREDSFVLGNRNRKIKFEVPYSFYSNLKGKDINGMESCQADGTNSTAYGLATRAEGDNSTAWGVLTESGGVASTAFGVASNAENIGSTAFGRKTKATGQYSTAWGSDTTASGRNATAWGDSSKATGSNSTASGGGLTRKSIIAVTSGDRWKTADKQTMMRSFSLQKLDCGDMFRGCVIAGGNGDMYLLDSDNNKAWFKENADFLIDYFADGDFTDPEKFKKKIAEIKNRGTEYSCRDNVEWFLQKYDGDSIWGSLDLENDDGNITLKLARNFYSMYGGSSADFETEVFSVASGENSSAHGMASRATGDNSTAWGVLTEAGGAASTAFGIDSNAENIGSTAFGRKTKATGEYSTAWGNRTEATGEYSTAWGNRTEATGEYSTAFGRKAKATGEYSTAWGNRTEATGEYSTAWGERAEASADNSTAWGERTEASAENSTAWGRETSASSDNSTAWGRDTSADGKYSTSFGRKSLAAGKYSLAFGRGLSSNNYCTASGEEITCDKYYGEDIDGKIISRFKNGRTGISYIHEYRSYSHRYPETGDILTAKQHGQNIAEYKVISADENSGFVLERISGEGDDRIEWLAGLPKSPDDPELSRGNVASGKASTAYGFLSRASGDYATAFGAASCAEGELSTAFGRGTHATGKYSTAWGVETTADGKRSTAFGEKTQALSRNSTAWGYKTLAHEGDEATAFGHSTEAVGKYSTAWGYKTKAEGTRTTSWGYKTRATAENATAWGNRTVATDRRATAWGYKTLAINHDATSFGHGSRAEGKHSTAWGYKTLSDGYRSTAFGEFTHASGKGALAFGRGHPVPVGTNPEEFDDPREADPAYGALGDYSLAFGIESTAIAANSIAALGGRTDTAAENSAAFGAGAVAHLSDSIALGSGSAASRAAGMTGYDIHHKPGNGAAWTATKNAVSVGDAEKDITRQITGVAAGTLDTDAVNVAQLKALWEEVEKTHTAVTVEGGETAKEEVAEDPDVSGENIRPSSKPSETDSTSGDRSSSSVIPSTPETDTPPHSGGTLDDTTDGTQHACSEIAAGGHRNNLTVKKKFVEVTNGGSTYERPVYDISLKDNLDLGESGSVKMGKTTINSDGINVNNSVILNSDGLKAGNTVVDSSGLKTGNTSVSAENITMGTDKKVNISSDGSADFGGITVDGAENNEISGLANTGYIEGTTGRNGRESIAATEGQLLHLAKNVGGDMTDINNHLGRLDSNVEDINNHLGNLDNRVDNIDRRIGDLDDDIKGTTALGTAMASLKPIQYDPMEPTQIMAGVGYYRDKWALALGMAHYVREDYMIHAGVSCGGSHRIAVGAGLTIKLGRREKRDRLPERYRKGPISSAYVMQRENTKLRKNVNDLERELNDVKASQLAEKRRNDALQKRLEHLEKLLAR